MPKKDLAPREFKPPGSRTRKGLFVIYTGNGKGKSTAAFGAALRCLGRGGRVAIVQFIKGPWLSGELKALEKFGDRVEFYKEGEGFTWDTKDLARDVASAEKGWERCLSLLKAHRHDMYIFDELLYVLKYKFLSERDILKGLSLKDPKAHIILTGRDAPPALIVKADLVTEMKEIKHPYNTQKIIAQPGIEY